MSLTSAIGIDYTTALSLTMQEAVCYIESYNKINSIEDTKKQEFVDDVDSSFIGVGSLGG